MSGHSKWSTIKRKKEAQDAKKGQAFTRLGKIITIAAREGGDPNTNFSLRLAIDSAKKTSMPRENIERAIKRGTGEGNEGEVIEQAVYGGYGPGGVAFAVDVTTDNKNRTSSELRRVFDEHGGNFSDASSVLWQFHEKGRVLMACAEKVKSEKFGEPDKYEKKDADEAMMSLMDIDGVEDVSEIDPGNDLGDEDLNKYEKGTKFCEVITAPKKLALVRDKIEELGFVIESVEEIKVPENPQKISKDIEEKIVGLLEALGEQDDVDNVWMSAEI